MNIHTLSELSERDFHLESLAVNGTIKRPLHYFRCSKNTRTFDRFYCIVNGVYRIQQDNYEPLTAKAGDILYMPNNCVYTAEWISEEIAYTTVEFQLADNNGLFSLSDRIYRITHDRSGNIGDMMERMRQVWTKGEIGYRLKGTSLFYELLHTMALSDIKADIRRSHADISAAILHLENNYIDDISTTELAKLCQMCESRFRARFREYAGMSPVRYRNLLRVKKAAALLSDGDYTVSEAAELVGIPDLSYFNRVFRHYIGKNPSELCEGYEKSVETVFDSSESVMADTSDADKITDGKTPSLSAALTSDDTDMDC